MPRVVPSYRYKPFPSGRDSIRLLRLLPDTNDDAHICCELIDANFGERTGRTYPYEALSYVWGNSTDKRAIVLNGHRFLVTSQLHEALSHLRYRYYTRIIWVDAVCIDQDDNEEKEQQIRLMPRIYNQAMTVIVWLGREADHSNIALEAIVCAGRDKTQSFTNKQKLGKQLQSCLNGPGFDVSG